MKNSISDLLCNVTSDEYGQIADRISYLRQNVLRMTQSQFASALNMSQTYLSQIENKKKTVTSTVLSQISIIFNVRLSWLTLISDMDDIFLSESEIQDYTLTISQEETLDTFCSAFKLQKSDKEFLQWYLKLSAEERSGFQQAVSFLRKID